VLVIGILVSATLQWGRHYEMAESAATRLASAICASGTRDQPDRHDRRLAESRRNIERSIRRHFGSLREDAPAKKRRLSLLQVEGTGEPFLNFTATHVCLRERGGDSAEHVHQQPRISHAFAPFALTQSTTPHLRDPHHDRERHDAPRAPHRLPELTLPDISTAVLQAFDGHEHSISTRMIEGDRTSTSRSSVARAGRCTATAQPHDDHELGARIEQLEQQVGVVRG
jgi:hypothetical protein